MQQKSSLKIQAAIYFLAAWQNSHSVFRRPIIAELFLGLLNAVLLAIFIFLVMISSTFSERITIRISSVHEFPRHSNSTVEVYMTNISGNRVAQAVENHSSFNLS